jgi:hypothetical protein
LQGESARDGALSWKFRARRAIRKPSEAFSSMAKYLQCSECGKLAFYYDDYVGTEKPFYLKYMRYPNDTKPQSPRCFSCGAVPRLIHEFIKEEKAGAKHE